jgi:hypothetical protein
VNAPAALYDWQEWHGGPCPVPPTERVEVVQHARHARGLALAFNWHSHGKDPVHFWRFERPIKPAREFER